MSRSSSRREQKTKGEGKRSKDSRSGWLGTKPPCWLQPNRRSTVHPETNARLTTTIATYERHPAYLSLRRILIQTILSTRYHRLAPSVILVVVPSRFNCCAPKSPPRTDAIALPHLRPPSRAAGIAIHNTPSLMVIQRWACALPLWRMTRRESKSMSCARMTGSIEVLDFAPGRL